jgi:ketosteroid isomerase-like protein
MERQVDGQAQVRSRGGIATHDGVGVVRAPRLVGSACCAVLALAACRTPGARAARAARAANGDSDAARVLDDWHAAAARADGDAYFAAFAPDATFVGTDATERWSLEEFRAYCEPYFERGQGWSYVPRDRHLCVAEDGRTAWFDERLDSSKYGEVRGSGVLVDRGRGWQLVHYVMSFPVPNELSLEIVERIRASRAPEP